MKTKTVLIKSLKESLKFTFVGLLASAISTLLENSWNLNSIINWSWFQGQLLVSGIIFPLLFLLIFVFLIINFKRKGKGK